MAGREDAVLVAARDKHQRAVDRHDLVEEHRDVHRPRLGHAVIARPGAVILVPLPDIAVERRLGVDLKLMHVELLAEQLLYRLDEPRMRAEQAETLIVGMRGKGGARRAGFFLPDFLAARPVDRLRIAAQGRDLFPPIEPYRTGRLRLDVRHTMYWEESGNPRGMPVLFLHGGPGAGATAVHRRFFDPTHWRIVIFDQRGAGRSTPLGEVQDNTPDHLASDIELLRQELRIDEWLLFGGSGLDTRIALRRNAFRPGQRADPARHLSVPARRGRLVPLWRAHDLSRGMARLCRVSAGGRARGSARCLLPAADRPRPAHPHAGGARLERL